ncbi:MAG: hypothetical protein IKL68_06205 [Clostridia bacterium]|nr:hypothetical protein [Clostridia bacterium]
MAIISLILGILSIALSWISIWGLVIAIFCVIVTAVLKKGKEYGKNKKLLRGLGLLLAISGLVISIFVTGLSVTESVIISKTNEGALNDVRASVSSATLMQAQQQASYAWSEARMKGLRDEKMEQYIMNSIQNMGIDTTNLMLELTKTGVIVKNK